MAGASGGGDLMSMFGGYGGGYADGSMPSGQSITSPTTYNTASTTTTTPTGFSVPGVAGTGMPTGGTPGTNIMGVPAWMNDYAASGATDMNAWFQQNVGGYAAEPMQGVIPDTTIDPAVQQQQREQYRRQMDRAQPGRIGMIRPEQAAHYNPNNAQPAAGRDPRDPFGFGGGGGGGFGGSGYQGMGANSLGPGAGPFRWQSKPVRMMGRRR